MAGKTLVIGASGFLGSRVTKQLVARGESDVRVLIRAASSTRGIGVAPPKFGVPIWAMSAASHVAAAIARPRNRDTMLTPLNIRLMHSMTPLNHSKAVRELGWDPQPTPEAIEAAAHFFSERRTEGAR